MRRVAAAGALAVAANGQSGIDRVKNMMEDMKATVEKEQKADDALWKKTKCFCDTNKKAKVKAIEEADANILSSQNEASENDGIEASTAAKIESLTAKIGEEKANLQLLVSNRNKQRADFDQQAADLKESVDQLSRAVEVLKKIHPSSFLQTLKQQNFKDAIQKDLWDMIGTLKGQGHDDKRKAFLQVSDSRDYKNMVAAPPAGANAANASYGSASGQIYGILQQMADDFSTNLKDITDSETQAQTDFAEAKAAKEAEIGAMESELADNIARNGEAAEKAAQAAAAAKAYAETLEKDRAFLNDLNEDCSEREQVYTTNMQGRSKELQALTDILAILNSDQARDLAAKAVSFLQVKKLSNSVEELLQTKAMAGTFADLVKALEDEMAVKKKEKTADEAKFQQCNGDLADVAGAIKDNQRAIDDATAYIAAAEAEIEKLNTEIAALQAQIKENQEALQSAGHTRTEENKQYLLVYNDAKISQELLKQCKGILGTVGYGGASLLQVKQPANVAGKAVGSDPGAIQKYEKNPQGESLGIMIDTVIAQLDSEMKEFAEDEQKSQAAYEKVAKDITGSITADNKTIADKNGELASFTTTKADQTSALNSANEEKKAFAEKQLALQHDCNWLVANYGTRMQAYTDEIEAFVGAISYLKQVAE